MNGDSLSSVEEGVRFCRGCGLCETRNKSVPGKGPSDADIMIVGEAPGRNEDIHGEPFVGRAGKFLDELLENAGLDREKVYITNIVKCRPPKNRNPKTEEISSCSPHLDRQIDLMKPAIIATLGNFSSGYILEKFGLEKRPIGEIHGKVFGADGVKIIPLYHPAAAIYNPNIKGVLFEDMKVLGKEFRTQ